MLRAAVKRLLRGAGYVASRYDPRRDLDAVRSRLFEANSIDAVLDVGANSGQYAERLRRSGYRHKIVSFEPQSAAFAGLEKRSSGDANWLAEHCALGDSDGMSSINIAANSASSSLLGMLPQHLETAPYAAYVGKEEITVRRLDSLLGRCLAPSDRIFLKIDTQGFTSKVLAGAERSLDKVLGLEVELSTVPLYEGEPLIHDVLSFLYGRRFAVFYLEPELLDDKVGRQLQLNGLFFRIP